VSRVAIVTGAARGIGAATALRLAQDGLAVAVLDLSEDDCRDTVAAIEAAGGRALAVGADVGDAEQVQSAVDRVAVELGPPVVLVNNAGVTRDNLLFKMTDADWDLVMHVHLRGSFLMTRAVQKHMIDQKWGRIVNLSSTSALGNRGQANYATAKAGLQGFTKTVAIELGKFGVTANAIAPGFIVSDMTKATAARIGQEWEPYVQARAAAIPVARAGQPEDVAHTVSFLASEGAGFISGQVIYVAGGPRTRPSGAFGVARPHEAERPEGGDPGRHEGEQDLAERQLEHGLQRAVQTRGLGRVERGRRVDDQAAHQRQRDALAGEADLPEPGDEPDRAGRAAGGVDLLEEVLVQALAHVPSADADQHETGRAHEPRSAGPPEDAGRRLLLRAGAGRAVAGGELDRQHRQGDVDDGLHQRVPRPAQRLGAQLAGRRPAAVPAHQLGGLPDGERDQAQRRPPQQRRAERLLGEGRHRAGLVGRLPPAAPGQLQRQPGDE
jgi:3-oxoacyl-[acyl-carrier protein] reductase